MNKTIGIPDLGPYCARRSLQPSLLREQVSTISCHLFKGINCGSLWRGKGGTISDSFGVSSSFPSKTILFLWCIFPTFKYSVDILKKKFDYVMTVVMIKYWLAWKRCIVQVTVDLPGDTTCLHVAFTKYEDPASQAHCICHLETELHFY